MLIPCLIMNVVNDDTEEVDEYTSAKKLVQRAADREALLSLFKKKNKSSSSDAHFTDSKLQSTTELGSDFSDLPFNINLFSGSGKVRSLIESNRTILSSSRISL